MEKTPVYDKVKLVTSVIYRERPFLEKAAASLERLFGQAESLQMDMDFDYTDYYREEFGYPLRRRILVFKELHPIEKAHLSKVSAIRLEQDMSAPSGRTVNVDPGYVTEAKLVLFTTKDYTHRLYAGDGIFSECTLFFRDGMFHPWQWTYPDYASENMRKFFEKVRDLYVKDLRSRKNG